MPFIRGLTPDFRVAIKREEVNATKTVQDLGQELTRLERGGIRRKHSAPTRVAQARYQRHGSESCGAGGECR